MTEQGKCAELHNSTKSQILQYSSITMEEEDEDDIYAPEDSIAPGQDLRPGNGTTTNASVNKAGNEEDEEEGEEVEEDESDSVSCALVLALAKALTALTAGYRHYYREEG